MIAVRIPAWAETQGMPPPGEDETFEAYWHRMGVPISVVAMALANLDPRAEDVANDRMADYIRRTCPDSFTRATLDVAMRYNHRDGEAG